MAKNNELSAIDDGLVTVILEARFRGFTVKSDFAREHADYVAMAASLQLITTRLYRDVFSREWRPTVLGLQFVEAMDLEDEDDNG